MSTTRPKKNASRRARRAEPADLFGALVGEIRQKRLGTVKKHPDGAYARVLTDGRTIGYVVPRRRGGARVFANALASDMPKNVSFEKVGLGSHHFGRGEVVVAVEEAGDFKDAERALIAAAKHPIPRGVK